MSQKAKIIALLVGIDVIFFDQIIKYFIIRKIPESGIFLINNTTLSFQLEKVLNTNIAFGLPIPKLLIFILTFSIIGILTLILIKNKERYSNKLLTAMVATIAAATSNLADRITYGGVVDYLSISIYNFHWPVFNLADMIIVLGIFSLIIINQKEKI